MLNQIFRFAKRKGYISDPPVIAIPSSRQNSRPDISETEWRTLYTYLRKYVKEAQDKRRHRERFYLQHYILILANSGIRVGEARHLRWRDISSTKTLSGQKRLIFTVRGTDRKKSRPHTARKAKRRRFFVWHGKGGAGCARGNSAAEPGKFFVCGKAALRRQLVDEAWYKLRQLRGHFLFGQACLFRQSLNNGRTKRRSE